MINGNKILKKKYPDFDDESRTPNGLDLRLGKVYELDDAIENSPDWFGGYGLYTEETEKEYNDMNQKELPKQVELRPKFMDCYHIEGWSLIPNKVYILEVDKQVRIDKDSAQLYRPRSTLLRAGVALYTATGDAGYNGHLSFMCINHGHLPFFLEKGVRFAQLIDFQVKGASISYDGDYQEESSKKRKRDYTSFSMK